LPFNIRLNSLISFAQGDRSHKLDSRERFRRGFEGKKYFMPSWVEELIRVGCASPDTATLSMQLLGKDICSTENLMNPDCLDDICWLTQYKDEMLDPRTIPHFELELASRPPLAEADTSANNDYNLLAPHQFQPNVFTYNRGGKRKHTRNSMKKRRTTRRKKLSKKKTLSKM
jgi:hypothetical protein